MNWSGISERSLVGKSLRFLLRFIPPHTSVPILQGALKGKTWIVGSSNHGCWLGSYEYDKQQLFRKIIRCGSVVFDIGGHVGFYTLLASELTGPSGKVVVFEPVPRNLFYLKEHLKLNRIDNVTVIESAVADTTGRFAFAEGRNSSMGHLATDGDWQVNTVALDDLLSMEKIPAPDYMKIDIEGAELLALSGARGILDKYHPAIFLATHGIQVHQECCRLLLSFGYRLHPIDSTSLAQSTELFAVYDSSGSKM